MPGAAWTPGRNRAPGRRTGPPGREDPYRRGDDPYPRDEDAQRTRAYSGDRERRDGQRYDEPGYRGRDSTGRGGAAARRRFPAQWSRAGAGLPEPGRLERPGPGAGRGPAQGRREPDAPAGTHRNPDGWYAPDDQSRDQAPRGRAGNQPRPAGQDAWRQAPPPAGPPRRPAGPPPPTAPVGPMGPASPPPGATEPDRGERAWWDDAFRPSSPAGPARPGPESPPPPAPPSGPPARPSRPAPPRRPSAQGYGVPPGELTQPIPDLPAAGRLRRRRVPGR